MLKDIEREIASFRIISHGKITGVFHVLCMLYIYFLPLSLRRLRFSAQLPSFPWEGHTTYFEILRCLSYYTYSQ